MAATLAAVKPRPDVSLGRQASSPLRRAISTPRGKHTGEDGASRAPDLDSAGFSVIDFVNQIFPNGEASLVGVDPLINKLKNRIRHVDAEILTAVRQQSTSGSQARHDLADAQRAIQELFTKIKEIKKKAEQSEVMVQEICRDIKKLDYAKKHLTTTITALRRLAMLVSAVDQLQDMAANRQYSDAANLLEAVNQLSAHFETYQQIPKISELRSKFQNIKRNLRNAIFDDFTALKALSGAEETGVIIRERLAAACQVVDSLEPSVREELVSSICGKELLPYQQIFQGTGDVTKLDKAERRYSWIKRQLATIEETWSSIFPANWRMQQLLCMEFCKITRAQMMESLDAQKGNIDVAALLQALQRTLDFEAELAQRFGSKDTVKTVTPTESEDEADVDDEPNQRVDAKAVRSKYAQLKNPPKQDEQLTPNELEDRKQSALAAAAARFNFRGTISSAFEPYMQVYVDLEEKTLIETLEKLIAEESWSPDDATHSKILTSSTQVFLNIKRSLKRCSALTTGQTLFNLFKVFQKVLRAYAAKLNGKLPKTAGPLVASSAGTTDWHVKLDSREERTLCFIINTGEYCSETAEQLRQSVAKVINASFIEQMDMSGEQEQFSGLITRALAILVLGIETRLEAALQGMAKTNWGSLEGVGDQSEYVNMINQVLTSSVPQMHELMPPLYFRFFCDKLAASFAPRFYVNIFKCKRISETGAQQMLLDTHAIKTLLMDVPTMGSQASVHVCVDYESVSGLVVLLAELCTLQQGVPVPASYSKYVTREMGKAEALLKVILSPAEGLADTYKALLPDSAPADFQRVLELKGLKKSEQQSLVDEYGRLGGGRTVPSTNPVASASATASLSLPGRAAVMQQAAAAAVASSSGLKKIFNLAESSKKESSFRKLFQ
eukprot:jgi/Chlat1/8395/Chrsp80S07907